MVQPMPEVLRLGNAVDSLGLDGSPCECRRYPPRHAFAVAVRRKSSGYAPHRAARGSVRRIADPGIGIVGRVTHVSVACRRNELEMGCETKQLVDGNRDSPRPRGYGGPAVPDYYCDEALRWHTANAPAGRRQVGH